MALAKNHRNSLHAQLGEAAANVAHYRDLRGDGDPLTIKINVEKELARWESKREVLEGVVDMIGGEKGGEENG